MKKEEFKNFLRRINAYYGYDKIISPERFYAWANKVVNIPKAAEDYIFEQITEQHNTMPRNLPKWIKEYFSAWRSADPGRQINPHIKKTNCTDCSGSGFIRFRKADAVTGMLYTYCARCGACRNWMLQVGESCGMAIKMKSDLLDCGYELID